MHSIEAGRIIRQLQHTGQGEAEGLFPSFLWLRGCYQHCCLPVTLSQTGEKAYLEKREEETGQVFAAPFKKREREKKKTSSQAVMRESPRQRRPLMKSDGRVLLAPVFSLPFGTAQESCLAAGANSNSGKSSLARTATHGSQMCGEPERAGVRHPGEAEKQVASFSTFIICLLFPSTLC